MAKHWFQASLTFRRSGWQVDALGRVDQYRPPGMGDPLNTSITSGLVFGNDLYLGTTNVKDGSGRSHRRQDSIATMAQPCLGCFWWVGHAHQLRFFQPGGIWRAPSMPAPAVRMLPATLLRRLALNLAQPQWR